MLRGLCSARKGKQMSRRPYVKYVNTVKVESTENMWTVITMAKFNCKNCGNTFKQKVYSQFSNMHPSCPGCESIWTEYVGPDAPQSSTQTARET